MSIPSNKFEQELVDATDPTRHLKVNADGSVNSQQPSALVVGAIAANGNAVTVPTSGYGHWSVDIRGTFTGTIQFEYTIDGTNWKPISADVMGDLTNTLSASSTTGNGDGVTGVGQWSGGLTSYPQIRFRASAWTSGSATVTVYTTPFVSVVRQRAALPPGSNSIGSIGNLNTPALGADGLALPTTAEVLAVNQLYNGSTLDLQRNNTQGTLLASQARTANTPSPVQTNYNERGVYIYINVSVGAGGTGMTPLLLGIDPITGVGWQIHASGAIAAITATGEYVYLFEPGASGTGSALKNVFAIPVPRAWSFLMNHSDGTSFTYSVAYAYVA